MKVFLDDFWYKGNRFDSYECDLPQVTRLDDIPDEKITEYITESLDLFLKEARR